MSTANVVVEPPSSFKTKSDQGSPSGHGNRYHGKTKKGGQPPRQQQQPQQNTDPSLHGASWGRAYQEQYRSCYNYGAVGTLLSNAPRPFDSRSSICKAKTTNRGRMTRGQEPQGMHIFSPRRLHRHLTLDLHILLFHRTSHKGCMLCPILWM